jgi:hypothetical protein
MPTTALEASYANQLISAGVYENLAKAAAIILAHHSYPLNEHELAILKSAWRQCRFIQELSVSAA